MKVEPDFESVRQLTREEAIAFGDSGIWKEWTHEQICDFQMWQEKLCVPFAVFQESVEKTLGRPVWTHEFGMAYGEMQQERLGKRAAPTFDEVLNLIPEEKRVVIFVDNEQEAA